MMFMIWPYEKNASHIRAINKALFLRSAKTNLNNTNKTIVIMKANIVGFKIETNLTRSMLYTYSDKMGEKENKKG